MKKNTNPYAKKTKRRLRITRKQWIAIISGAAVIAIIIGIMVVGNLSKAAISNPHAGHNHAPGEECNTGTADPHAGHNHDSQSAAAKVKYQLYTNADKTFRLAFLDTAGKVVAEFDKLSKAPIKETVDADKGIYTLGWANGDGPNDYEQVYYNEKTGQVSAKFRAPRGTDGVRIAYGSEDQTKVIVEDLFDSQAYHQEYTLEGAMPNKNGEIILGGKLHTDKKTVLVSYVADKDGSTRYADINLYP